MIKKGNNIILLPAMAACLILQLAKSEPIRIMPLGDSITHGYGSGISILNSYRKTLKALLSENGYTVDFVGGLADGDFLDNQHHGHDGWFADHTNNPNTIVSYVAEWMSTSKADVVLLHIGTNDIIHDNADASEVSLILEEIFATNANATVVLALIINTQPVRTDITTYNSNLNVMAQARIGNGDDIIVVDMENGTGIDYTSADMADPYHPSQLGYDKMGTNWYPGTIAAINRQRLKKRPRIEVFSITTNMLWMDLGNLCTGQSTSIEQTGSLVSNAWTNVYTFTPLTTSTNWSQPVIKMQNAAFFRIHTE